MKCVCSFPNYLNLNNHALELYFSKAGVYNFNRNCTELFCLLSIKSRIISNAMKKFGCPTLYSQSRTPTKSILQLVCIETCLGSQTQYAGRYKCRQIQPFYLLSKPLSVEEKTIIRVNTSHRMTMLAMEYSILKMRKWVRMKRMTCLLHLKGF